MLAGFLLGFAHDRRLMREAQADIAIRRFIGCGLDDRLPDHSSLTRIRQRWGEARFRKIFPRTVSTCVDAGIAKGEVVHVDATLVRADAGWRAWLTAMRRRWFPGMVPQRSKRARRTAARVWRRAARTNAPNPASSSIWPSADASKERRGPAVLPAPFLAVGGLPRRNEDPARAAPRRAARSRKHEDPVLPNDRRDQPEAASGRFRRAIPRLRLDSDARNARFRGSGATGRPDPSHARRIRLTPPGGPPTGRAALASPEIAECRVIQRPRMNTLPHP